MTDSAAPAQASAPAHGEEEPKAAPPPAAPPAFVPMPLPRTLMYMMAACMISITQGLGQGFISANISQIAGELGATVTQTSWLMAAYLIPRAALPLMLIKIRTQYGLRMFAEVAIPIYFVLAFASLWIIDLRSALIVQFVGGMASAPLSTLAFLYMIEPLPPQWKMRLGMPMVMVLAMMGPSLARVVSPALFGDSGWAGMHLMMLGMAAICLALVYLLPLKSAPKVKAISPLDIVSWLFIAVGFAGVIIPFTMGSIYWWTEAPWIGAVLVLGIASLTIAVVIELNRKAPLLDIRWLTSPAIVHLAITLLIFRLILSEQSTGAPRMFQVLGITQGQLVPLFSLICLMSILGGFACVAFMKLERVPYFHLVALIMIGAGAWLDSNSTIDTRPAQMMLSQSLIAFAGSLFIAPALLRGLMAALARGPNYILSFFIVFISTQSIGGAMGSGIFTTIINHRQAFHAQVLNEQLSATSLIAAGAINTRMAALGPQIVDPALRKAQAVSMVATDVSNQAYVMAYNDIYFLTFLIAMTALAALLLHLFRDWLVEWLERRRPPTEGRPSADTEVAANPSATPAAEPAR